MLSRLLLRHRCSEPPARTWSRRSSAAPSCPRCASQPPPAPRPAAPGALRRVRMISTRPEEAPGSDDDCDQRTAQVPVLRRQGVSTAEPLCCACRHGSPPESVLHTAQEYFARVTPSKGIRLRSSQPRSPAVPRVGGCAIIRSTVLSSLVGLLAWAGGGHTAQGGGGEGVSPGTYICPVHIYMSSLDCMQALSINEY